MKTLMTLVAIALIALGVWALVAGGFEYTEERHDLELGPVELSVADKEHVAIPTWAGIAAIAAGAGILLVRKR